MLVRFLLFLLSLIPFSNAQNISSGTEAIPYVFKSGTDGYKSYRIPAVVVTNKGTLVSFAEGRVNHSGDDGNIDIVARRSEDGGRTWSELVLVQNDGEYTCGNPAPVVDRSTGRILLLSCGSTASEGAVMDGRFSREVYMQYSDDDGRTWTKRKNISNQVKRDNWRWYATGPCSGIQIREGKYKGRLVIPANHSDENKVYRSHCFYSDDHGMTWELGSSAGDGSNESQIVEISPELLVQNMRMQTHGKGFRGIRTSRDGGRTWSELEHDENLPCPRCQGSVMKDMSGNGWLYFSNPAAIPRSRKGMSIRVSTDKGKSWPWITEVYHGPSGYSNLVMINESSVGILYEAGEKDLAEGIAFRSYPVKSLIKRLEDKKDNQ